ncbi:SusC/RagA family TonB-linked outer membrane protein [Muriicola sp. Z0-33]|uniref:SusC/RagA family TonB-linked outer membrane protein n=1 Tax=Muriicola sp. Z0-33 TaxID=2816957 RepID=UPI0022379A5D|nr:SusC/RagA family TonB-linked outer membrane protein [Muriicola sp. Z0-33]MCW5516781.1 SusC/RagA family TonB-linked outer membrane protein [Muriicola sp. Z0-33]
MRTNLNGILTLFLAFFVHISFAQEKTISGTVTDQQGLPLPGVNIVVEGTTTGTQTDFDGNYAINASAGQVLLFSYIGQKDERRTVGAENTINLQMTEDAQALEEVVVTALGVKREQRSLGYSIAKVDGDEVTQRPEADVARLLSGKAAGVNITSSNGLSGSSTNIIIRGFTSITGSNQPLFVVDGVPFGSDTNNNEAFFDNATESSRFLDLDPNNIENINVLKGLSATSLYGNRGRNGVILITTKNAKEGAGKTTVSISSSIFYSNPHLPDYQNDYGNGFNQEFGWFFSNWGPRFGDTNPNIWTGYLSSIKGGQVFLNHPFASNQIPSYATGYEDLRDGEYEYKPYNSVPEFFRTGVFTSQSIGLNGGDSDYSYNVTYSRVEDKSFVPGNSLNKNNFGVGGSAKMGKLTVNAGINIALTDLKSPPVAASRGSGVNGDGASIFGDLMYTPRSVDLSGIPFERITDGGNLYYRESNSIQNPRWTVKNSKTGQKVDRFFGNFNMTYQLSDNLNANYRYGIDIYNESSFYGQNAGGPDGNALGLYRTQSIRNAIKDHNFTLNYDKDLTDDLNLKVIVGANANSVLFERDGLESNRQIVFGVLKHWNFTDVSSTNSFNEINFQRTAKNNTVGFFGDITLGYKNYLYLNGAVRRDWTSTLESDNNAITYPSASVSFIATNAFEQIRSDKWGLNDLKIRFGYGSSAGFPDVYSTRNTLSLSGRSFVKEDGSVVSANTTSDILGNPALKPETVSELELGIDARLLDRRLGINASIFKRKTEDLITNKDLDPSTGFTNSTLNGGDLEVKGVEVDLDVDVFRSQTRGFAWNTNINFYADESLVTRLPEGIDQIIIGNFFNADAKNAAIVGKPFGVLIGDAVRRDADGNKIITTSNGFYDFDPDDTVIGDPNPDWTSSLTNTFKFKGFSLSALLSYRHGGDIYSKTAVTLLSRGVIDFPFDRLGSFVLPGVGADGSPNTTQIGASDIAFENWLGGDEFEIWDGSTLRLAEVSVGYELSSKALEKTPFTSMSFKVSGSNLWYKAFNFPDGTNIDTNTLANGVGNNIGLEYFSGPSSRRYGFSVKASF